MGRRHAELAAGLAEARLVAVTDPDPDRLKRAASDFGTNACQGVADLVGRTDVDAVIIAGPVETHVEHVMAVAAEGKDILCEKPLAGSVFDCREALDACAKAGLRLQVGFMRRYDPAYREGHDAVTRGRIGRPVLLTGISRDAKPPDRAYLTSPEAANLFLESAVHDFDLARWFLEDDVESVTAAGAMISSPEIADVLPCDVGHVILHFRGGAVAVIQNYKNAGYGYDIRTEVVGTEGAIVVGSLPPAEASVHLLERGDRRLPQHWLERFDDAYRLQLEDWVYRMRNAEPTAVTGEDGLMALAIGEAADESARTGRPVTLNPLALASLPAESPD